MVGGVQGAHVTVQWSLLEWHAFKDVLGADVLGAGRDKFRKWPRGIP